MSSCSGLTIISRAAMGQRVLNGRSSKSLSSGRTIAFSSFAPLLPGSLDGLADRGGTVGPTTPVGVKQMSRVQQMSWVQILLFSRSLSVNSSVGR